MFTIDPKKYRIVDLSYTVVPPGSDERPFRITKGYLADRAYKHDVETHTHVGTHVEAPAHFFDGGKDVVDLPLEWFMGRGILIDVKDAKKHHRLGAAELEELIGDIIRTEDIVICRNSDKACLAKGVFENYPYICPEGARWLREKRIKMLGIDNFFGLGADDMTEGRELHDILQSQDVTLLEWMDHLDELTQREFFFMALPFKVKEADSSWCRAIAIEEK